MVGGRRRKKGDSLEVPTASRGKKACSCSPAAPPLSPLAFFKVMIGNFRDVMFIPPQSACNLDDLVNKDVHLEDFEGNSSKVKISMVDGSLAFQQGWSDFVLAHSVEVGEVLIFNYTSWSMFSVWVFGTSGCERTLFSEGNGSNPGRRKRKKTHSHTQDLNLSKKSKSNGDLKDICYIYDEGEVVKEVVDMERDPSDLLSKDVIDTDLVAITMDEGPNASRALVNDDAGPARQETKIILSNGVLEDICYIYDEDEEVKEVVDMESDPSDLLSKDIVDTDLVAITTDEDPNASGALVNDDAGPARQKTEIVLSFSESPSLVDDKYAAKLLEGKITLSDCSNAQAIHEDSENGEESNPEAPLYLLECATTITKDCLDDKEQHPPDEHCHGRSQTASESECMKFGALNLIKSGCIPETDATCRLDEEQKLISQDRIICKLLLTEDGICHIRYEKLAAKIITKFLATEDGVCHILYEKLLDELRESRATPPNLCLDKDDGDKCVAMPNETDNLADETRTEPTLQCSEDERGNGKGDRSIKEVPPQPVGSVADGREGVPGTLPGILPENEKLTPFSNVESLGVVKTEPLGFDDYSSLKSINFSFSVPPTLQSWLELPKCLHKRYSRKKHERKIVLLRDPLMRLWPVLYHEKLMFTGFASGWNAFAASNNLQQGDVCEFFEVFEESNEVYQVQISKV